MKPEQKQQLELILRFILIGVFGFLYSQGGMENGGGIWIRRFLAPFILSLGCFFFSGNWKYFLLAPFQMASLCLGYGADDFWIKIGRRSFWGLVNGLSSGLPIMLASLKNSHMWFAFSLQVLFVLSASVFLGVWNPLPNARIEEFTIGCIIAFLPVMCASSKRF